MSKRILLFAGTTEGRVLAGHLAGKEASVTVCVATGYGGERIPEAGNIRVLSGRLDEPGMEKEMEAGEYGLVVDATHPYAREVSENIRTACARLGKTLVRVLREDDAKKAVGLQGEGNFKAPRMIRVPDAKAAADFLASVQGKILLTTGSKELAVFCELPCWRDRVYARVLSTPEAVETCAGLGFSAGHLFAMQGPFSEEMNLALIHQAGVSWIVTKESGRAGGFEEKLRAAAAAGIGAVVIGRPEEETGMTLDQAIRFLEEECKSREDASFQKEECKNRVDAAFQKQEQAREPEGKRLVYLVGTGPGDPKLLTGEAAAVLKSCDLIFGAERVVRRALVACGLHAPGVYEYAPEAVKGYLRAHPQCRRAAVALSGDVGFYSGARGLFEAFCGEPDFEVRAVCGISAAAYFFSKIGRPWEDVKFISRHGKKEDLISAVKANRLVFAVLGGKDAGIKISRELLSAGLGEVSLIFGENLSLPEEGITAGRPADFTDRELAPLAVACVENREAGGESREACVKNRETGVESREAGAETGGTEAAIGNAVEPETGHGLKSGAITHGISDDEFLRGTVPMTKMEVRCVSISKLRLSGDAVVYDIGAGTGSVAVECAGLLPHGRVYAIERNPEALGLLAGNREKFSAGNMEIVAGTAPDILADLPAPTHVFIGGSGGRLREILRAVLEKNPRARVVVNAIALETVAELMEIMRTLPIEEAEIVQISAARDRKAGAYHMMSGQNPVYIASFRGKGGERTWGEQV